MMDFIVAVQTKIEAFRSNCRETPGWLLQILDAEERTTTNVLSLQLCKPVFH